MVEVQFSITRLEKNDFPQLDCRCRTVPTPGDPSHSSTSVKTPARGGSRDVPLGGPSLNPGSVRLPCRDREGPCRHFDLTGCVQGLRVSLHNVVQSTFSSEDGGTLINTESLSDPSTRGRTRVSVLFEEFSFRTVTLTYYTHTRRGSYRGRRNGSVRWVSVSSISLGPEGPGRPRCHTGLLSGPHTVSSRRPLLTFIPPDEDPGETRDDGETLCCVLDVTGRVTGDRRTLI